MRLFRISSSYFVGGIVLDSEEDVTKIAPIIKYMISWNLTQIKNYCYKKEWKIEEIKIRRKKKVLKEEKFVLIVDGNLFARKMFYKFKKLRTTIKPSDLNKISPKLNEKYKKEKRIKVESKKKINHSNGEIIKIPPGPIDDKLRRILSSNKEVTIPTGVTYGMLRTLIRLYRDYPIGETIFCFDPMTKDRGNQKRFEIYPEYKISRSKEKETDKKKTENEEFYEQLNIVHYLLYVLGIKQTWVKTFEADDLMHYFSLEYSKKNKRSLLLTNDHDLLQALSGNVSLLKLGNKTGKEIYSLQDFVSEFKISPKQYTDVMTLCGCKGDDVPGLSSVSEDIAMELIREFKDIQNLLGTFKKKKSEIPPKAFKSIKEDSARGFRQIKKTRKLIKLYGKNPILKKEFLTKKRKYEDKSKALRNTLFFLKLLKFKSMLGEKEQASIKKIIDSQ